MRLTLKRPERFLHTMLLAGARRSAEEIAPGNELSACVATAGFLRSATYLAITRATGVRQ